MYYIYNQKKKSSRRREPEAEELSSEGIETKDHDL